MVMVCRRWRLPVRPYECVTKVPSKDPRLLGGLVASWMRQARREGALSEGAAEGRDEVLHRQDAQVQPAGDEMTRQDKTRRKRAQGRGFGNQHNIDAILEVLDLDYRQVEITDYMGVGFRLAFGEGALELKVYARVLGTALVNWPQNERALLPDDTSVRLMPPVDPRPEHWQNNSCAYSARCTISGC